MLNQGGHFYVCGSARQVPEDIYTAMKEASWLHRLCDGEEALQKHARCLVRQVMMAHERCPEEEAEAILSNLKMEGRCSACDVEGSLLEKHACNMPFNRI